MIEIWKNIKGFPMYEISNTGNVRSLRYGKIKLLKLVNRKDNYQSITLRNKGEIQTFLIHRLVYLTFNDLNVNGYYIHIDHINNNRADNNILNLQLLTARENSIKINLKNKTSKYKGVSFDKRKNKWRSHIRINSKQICLGSFKNEDEASLAYINARKKLLEI